jgi:hypothetical protein
MKYIYKLIRSCLNMRFYSNLKEKSHFTPQSLERFSIQSSHTPKLSNFCNLTNFIPKFPYYPLFFLRKKIWGAKMARWPKEPPQIFLKFFIKHNKIKNYGQYEKFGIKLVKWQKIESLRGALQKLKHCRLN